jgi:hypothetical protein
VVSLINRVIDPQSCEFDIVRKEMANPTGLLKKVMREEIEPMRRRMGGIVRDLLGEGASERNVRLCQMSIISQCLNPMLRKRSRRQHHDQGPPPDFLLMQLDLEAIADHIVRFSLGGIRAARAATAEKNDKGAMPDA